MSIRRAKNRMTGYTSNDVEVSLGYRVTGEPQIRIQGRDWEKYICIREMATLTELIEDLQLAVRHFEAGTYDEALEND